MSIREKQLLIDSLILLLKFFFGGCLRTQCSFAIIQCLIGLWAWVSLCALLAYL